MDAIAAALVTALVGGPIVYVLGNRRLQFERLYERRAEVMANLSQLLWDVQREILIATDAGENSRLHLERSRVGMNELLSYYGSNRIWLDTRTLVKIGSFMHDISVAADKYLADLDESGHPRSQAGQDAANQIREIVPNVNAELEADFREILYPPPWYDAPLRLLRQLEVRKQKSAAHSPGSDNQSNTRR